MSAGSCSSPFCLETPLGSGNVCSVAKKTDQLRATELSEAINRSQDTFCIHEPHQHL